MKPNLLWAGLPVVVGGLALIGYLNMDRIFPPEITDLPELVEIPAGTFHFRMNGQFRVGKHIVDAPLQELTDQPPLTVMKYHVSQAEYARCVADGACEETVVKPGENLPQVMISYYDARAYAKWFSEKTRLHWRLPSALEFQRYAGDAYIDLSLGDMDDEDDPAQRWIAEYLQQSELRRERELNLYELGTAGENNFGVADVASNVWEWTDTCYYNVKLDSDGKTVLDRFENCAVRAAEGKHTAYIIEFVRDANVGGCAVGVPPDFLGFRLILDG
ncbi:MAG: hypothetical protein CSA68_07830 [Rhodobacterales bacterium]|nr:MAG: hypothetical protein CSA68_07830 [Rhodobacterales bacterium]